MHVLKCAYACAVVSMCVCESVHVHVRECAYACAGVCMCVCWSVHVRVLEGACACVGDGRWETLPGSLISPESEFHILLEAVM